MKERFKCRGLYENRWKNPFIGLQMTKTHKLRVRSSLFLREESHGGQWSLPPGERETAKTEIIILV
jgi:hypothetical protein